MATAGLKKALKRLEKDQKELIDSPMPDVSAVPLESNVLEWHCNIRFKSNIYHLILFFSKEYPCVPPSAEIVPFGFNMDNMTVTTGEKGEKICIDILSDFAHIHPEWALLTASGWSPSYTVQTLLLNLLSYFYDIHQDEDLSLVAFQKACKTFVCPDCGHSQETPYPSLLEESENYIGDTESQDDPDVSLKSITPVSQTGDQPEPLEAKIVDYMSRESFSAARKCSPDQVFGYGIVLSKYEEDCCPTSPCEFLTASSFYEMRDAVGKAVSILKEDLSYYLPLYITADHSSKMRPLFEETMGKLAKRFRLKISLVNSFSHVTINVLSHLIIKSVEKCNTCTPCTTDKNLVGYFQLHRLFLWVLDTYPNVRKCVNKRLQNVLSNPTLLKRKFKDDFDLCFALLSVSAEHSWETIANVYVKEHWRRCAKWYLGLEPSLGSIDTPLDNRLQKTFELIKNDCFRLAYQIVFLRIARPAWMTKDEILQRYEENLCLPTQGMVSEMSDMFKKISYDINSFEEWFQFIGLPVPSREDLHGMLKETVKYCKATRVYQCHRPGQPKQRCSGCFFFLN